MFQFNKIASCTDLNSKASEAVRTCARSNQVPAIVESIHTNLTDGLDHRLKGKVDLMVVNPPYVPTDDEEVGSRFRDAGLSQAWSGGQDGRRVIDRFLNQCPDLIAPGGLLFVVLLKENRPRQVMQRLREQNFDCRILMERQCRNELLCIVKCRRN